MTTTAATQRLVAELDTFLKFVRARVTDRETALDILQDALAKALAKIGDLRDEDKVVAWFYSILRATITDLHRSRASEAKVIRHDDAAATSDQTPSPTPTEAVARDCVRQLLHVLPADQAELLERVDLGSETPAHFAKRHHITDSTFRVRRHRARQALKEAIETVCSCSVDPDADCVCASC
jgi:RNA polymerase sigma-70 factor (ECF subfamily)